MKHLKLQLKGSCKVLVMLLILLTVGAFVYQQVSRAEEWETGENNYYSNYDSYYPQTEQTSSQAEYTTTMPSDSYVVSLPEQYYTSPTTEQSYSSVPEEYSAASYDIYTSLPATDYNSFSQENSSYVSDSISSETSTTLSTADSILIPDFPDLDPGFSFTPPEQVIDPGFTAPLRGFIDPTDVPPGNMPELGDRYIRDPSDENKPLIAWGFEPGMWGGSTNYPYVFDFEKHQWVLAPWLPEEIIPPGPVPMPIYPIEPGLIDPGFMDPPGFTPEPRPYPELGDKYLREPTYDTPVIREMPDPNDYLGWTKIPHVFDLETHQWVPAPWVTQEPEPTPGVDVVPPN